MSARAAASVALAAFALVAAPTAWGQDVRAGREKAAPCQACHGPDGNSTIPLVPILAGQTARYLYLQLRDFREGRRHDPQMDPVVASLSREDMLDLAAFFAAQPLRSPAFKRRRPFRVLQTIFAHDLAHAPGEERGAAHPPLHMRTSASR